MSRVLRDALGVCGLALLLRALGVWMLGEGAPFGPDGTGAEAAVFLGGHPYPLHIVGIGLMGGSATVLSVVAGTLACIAMWDWSRSVGIGGMGGWLLAALPLAVLTGALAAGDAPALAVVLVGVALAAHGRVSAIVGGVVAVTSLAVKPVAAPALVLLLAHPWSLIGAVPTAIILGGFTRPLWAPMTDGGLLGSWWVASGGVPPTDVFAWLVDGVTALATAPLWACVWLLPLSWVGVARWRGTRSVRWAGLGPTFAALAVACAFGDKLEARYLTAPIAACLPWVGVLLPDRRRVSRLAMLPLIWIAFAVLTQLSAVRDQQDPVADVPALPELPFPVDVRPLFDACSTPDATRLRHRAREIATEAPQGATIVVDRRPDGREGELIWPLKVLRPDVQIEVR